MAEIIWTEPAVSDLDAIADFIALDKPKAASELVRRIFAHVELPTAHPESGSLVRELPRNPRFRQLVEPPCRIFHRFDRGARRVYVLGVMRGEKLFQKKLLRARSKNT